MTKKKSHGKSKKLPVYSSDMLALQLIGGFVLIGLGVLIFLSVVVRMQGDIFSGMRSVCYGMSGALAPVLGVFPVWGGVLMILSTQQKAPVRMFALAFLIFMLVLSCANLLTYTGTRTTAQPLLDYFASQGYASRAYGPYLQKAYVFSSTDHPGMAGGWMGMVTAWPLWTLIGSVPAAIVCIVVIVAAFLLLIRFDPGKVMAFIQNRAVEHQAARDEQRRQADEQDRIYQQQQAAARAQAQAQSQAQTASDPQDWQQYRAGSARPGYGPQQYQPQPEQNGYTDMTEDNMTPVARPVARSRRKPAVQPADYGFQPTEEETTTIPQSLADEPKQRKSRILGGQTGGMQPAKPKRRSIFSTHRDEDDGFDTPQPDRSIYSRPAAKPASAQEQEPVIEDGQVVQPWQARTAPAKKVAPAPTAPVTEDADRPMAHAARAAAAPAEKPAKIQPKPSWTDDDTPPWEDQPTPVPMDAVRVPVVQQESPEGWLPDPELAPVKAGQMTYGMQQAEEEAMIPEVPYVYPGLELLNEPVEQTGISPEEDAMRAQRLEETLASFKVQATVKHITHGPAISRFELELAAGINVNRVTNLGANIAMNMEVKSVRIEAPIPGKSLVGIEVPNRKVSTVTLRELMESEAMAKAKSPLVVALGKDIAGTPIVCDLARMPHLLIAGATGSGKSVCINTMINSLLYRCSPKEVRLILVDPKVVELQCYNGIPHLLIPVVSDPHKAAGALAWAVAEMMDRYKKFQLKGVRAIDGYNATITDDSEFMPRIVIIIDELADLMMTCKRDVEDHICRLAQLARAAGIHLVVATQRPSVDVITGLIKANIPSRIAFKVSSFIDSRTILDKNGAEQLLGWGDMLYQPTGEFTPIRIQGCYLSDNEVNAITDFIRSTCPSSYDPSVIEQLDQLQREASGAAAPDPGETEADLTGDGSLLEQAIEMAVRDGQVSTSLIQRRLKIGYARAGRLVDEMEKRGIVSQKDGAKPRMCLITMEDYEQMRSTNQLAD